MKTELPNDAVKHVVVLMLENRGFDHIMGWLYGPDDPPLSLVGGDGGGAFNGLSMMTPDELAALANPYRPDDALPLNKGARSPKTPAFNTGESFPHIFNQMWGGTKAPAVWEDPAQRQAAMEELGPEGQPKMDGYVLDYIEEVLHHCNVNLDRIQASEVLDIYLPCQLPVLSGLARYHAISDAWFCSVPSQTNTNRAFSVAGTSRGMVSNSFFDPPDKRLALAKWIQGGVSNLDALPVSTRSIFEVLQQENFSWKYYFQDWWPPRDIAPGFRSGWQYTRTMIPLLGDAQFNPNFVMFDASNPDNQLFQDIQNGQLPAVTWIEPKWGGGPRWETVLKGEHKSIRAVGNDYHPVSDTTLGEDFVANLYSALASGRQWNNTLFIITFDENGGTYDHVLPPDAVPSGLDGCPLPRPTDWAHMDAETRTQYGFKFDQYGVRVPTLLISPRIPPKTIFRSATEVPYDHTSILATILTLAEIDQSAWELGARTDGAPTFVDLVTGDLREDYNPAQALKAPSDQPAEPHAANIYSNTPYLLEYIGNPWGATASARCYLGPSTNRNLKMPTYYFPTLVASADEAVQFTLVSDAGLGQRAAINNMSIVKIKSSEPVSLSWIRSGYTLVTVNNVLPWAFYGNNGATPGARWQIRILNSRDPGDVVSTGDRVYFVSQLDPTTIQSVSARSTPDPMQRLMPLGPENQYLTTQAGEWALWRLVPAPMAPEDAV